MRAESRWGRARKTVPTPDSPATAAASTPGRAASAMTVSTPDQVAILAAATLEAMPPLPTALPGPPAICSRWWSISATSSIREASATKRGSAVEQPRRIGQQHQQVGPDEVRHQRRQPVVVPEADLLVGHRVVLVDHRDHAQLNEVIQGAPGVQVLGAVHEIQGGQEHLPGEDPVRIEPVLPHAHEPVLADGGHRLQHGRVGGTLLAPAQRGPPGRDGARRHDDHGVTGRPELGDFGAQAVDGGRRDRGGADLDDDDAVRPRWSRRPRWPAFGRGVTVRPR